ncbi:esterase-like activity of phytase family protein [Hymenobacter sp. BT188]|uniref:esterase-like activity of phytase family protein n=1 Tax=Hymenobacter sp. BT188 TaxID=2763504 RepID=UPI001650FD67|nr:esterase-like activity of phytase family protein [Hymenobacter sp. BT188]MBC6607865.1 esterase-like activity of phytase family protein [Hymenobacter sp. BT188]
MKHLTRIAACCSLAFLAACNDDNGNPFVINKPIQVTSLRFIGEQIVPFGQTFNGTTLGGFSSIDYRADNGSYYIMCDDASALQPVRYYTANLNFNQNQFSGVTFTSVTTLKRPDGSNFPSLAADRNNAIDPEGIRYDPTTMRIIWSSEGIRNVTLTPPTLNQPFLREANLDGSYVADFSVPSLFRIQATENGTRSNGGFEGIDLTADGRYLFAAQEEPLYEDGPRADVGVANSPTRIVQFNKATRQPIAQYAYQLDAVHQAPNPSNQFRLNGIVEVLTLSDKKLLVMERSFAVGATPDYSVKIYEVELAGATNISGLNSLQGANYKPVRKRLLLDVASTGIRRIDNLEGMTFGPKLPNGNRSLILVSDDNFSNAQISQFLAFEVRP